MEFKDALKDTLAQAKIQRVPVIGLFELTGRCNFNCKMCYVHEMNAAEALKQELSADSWKSIFDDMIDNGMLYAVLSGGECLLRSDFCDLYLYLFRKGIKISVNTNGSLIDPFYLKFFKKYKPFSLQISLYGCTEEGYRNVTERAAFSKVADALARLKEARIPFKVQITPCRALLVEFDSIIRFLINNEYHYSIGEFLIANKDGDSLEDMNSLSLDEYLSLLYRNAKLRNKLYTPPENLPEVGGDGNALGQGITCSAGTCRATIDWHGDLYACYALKLPKYNVLKLGFEKAWELLGKDVRSVSKPAECSGCAYEKICTICPAIRSDGLSSGHCNRDCCDYTKRLCEFGIRKFKQK